mmetsp:Transcript_28764/g.58934  ORF Transcript_28764/g.58934 Transcript_28764/m.58934 type:complete len:92 (+) Transcript_28764:117-392(+)
MGDCFPDCEIFHNKFSNCLKPTQQMAHIYHHGVAENCGEYVHDWRKCIGAKMTNNEEEIKKSYQETNWYKQSFEPGNTIFEFKKQPSWYSD